MSATVVRPIPIFNPRWLGIWRIRLMVFFVARSTSSTIAIRC